MKKNVGSTDSYIRFMVGISLLLNIIILEPGTLGTVVLTALGLSTLYSAYSKFCPLYLPFGICTCDSGCGCSCETEAK